MRRIASTMVACGATLVALHGLRAQSIPCPPATGEPFLRCQVDSPAKLRSLATLPLAPEVLKAQTVPFTAEVFASFVIDETGRVVMSSLALDTSTNSSLASAVRNALHRSRYVPARRGGQQVRQLSRVAYLFLSSTGGLADDMPLDSTRRVRTLADGTEQFAVGRAFRDAAGASGLSPKDIAAAVRAGSVHVSQLENIPEGATPSDSTDPSRLLLVRTEPWSAREVYMAFSRTTTHSFGTTMGFYTCGALRDKQQWKTYCRSTFGRGTVRNSVSHPSGKPPVDF